MIKATVETITPELARDYLEHNTDNYRKLSRSIVNRYAAEIAAGRWEMNGETIVFNEDGVLVDGQHRLAGVVVAGKPIKTVVIRGVRKDVSIYDMGSNRTVAQIAAHDKIDCNQTVSAAANIIVNNFRYNCGKAPVIDFIRSNIDELNRAYRVACYGSVNLRSKCAPAVAACYLAIHTQAIPVYEVELFFRLFNDPWTTSADGYDISPALTAVKMFDARVGQNGYQIQKERLEIICLAIRDFHERRAVTDNYMIKEPFFYQELMDETHAKDGLD